MNPLMRMSASDSSPAKSATILKNFHEFNNNKHDSGPTNISDYEISTLDPMEQKNIDTHVDLPSHLKSRISRHFTFKVFGSMDDLAKNPDKLLSIPLDPDIFKSHSRYRVGATKRSPELRGDLDQVVLLGAQIVSYQNNFPVSLNINFVSGDSQDEFSAFRGNYRSVESGDRTHYTVPPNNACGNANKPINLTSPFIHSNYISNYSGLTNETQLRNNGIHPTMEPEESMIALNHPVMSIINANQGVLNEDGDHVRFVDMPSKSSGKKVTVALVSDSLKEQCLELLVNDLEQNLPIFDIKKMRMKISRPGIGDGQFNDSGGIEFEPSIAALSEIKDSSDAPRFTQTNTNRSCEVVCNLTYAILSSGDDNFE